LVDTNTWSYRLLATLGAEHILSWTSAGCLIALRNRLTLFLATTNQSITLQQSGELMVPAPVTFDTSKILSIVGIEGRYASTSLLLNCLRIIRRYVYSLAVADVATSRANDLVAISFNEITGSTTSKQPIIAVYSFNRELFELTFLR
jgi:hypothetical protein